jgi:hypothetical protein
MKAAMKSLALALAALAAGCVGSRINSNLTSLIGQNISAAVDKLGYPDGQREMLGDTLYIWSTDRSGLVVVPTTSTTSGNVGGTPYSQTTTGFGAMPAHFHCRIELAVTAAGIIKRFQFDGNNGGCARYANALARK